MTFIKKPLCKGLMRQPAFGRTGQAPIEILAIVALLIGMLLIIIIASYLQNSETIRLMQANSDSLQCGQISSAIGRLYSNRANTVEMLPIASDAILRKMGTSPGQIKVGGTSCPYLGSVQLNGTKDTDAELNLVAGEWCFQMHDTEILLTEGVCT